MTLGAERVTHGCHASRAQQCDCSTMLWPFVTQRSQWSQFTSEDATNCQRYCWGIMAEFGGAGRLVFPGFEDVKEPPLAWDTYKTKWSNRPRMMQIWVSFQFVMLLSAAAVSNLGVRAMSLENRLSNDYWLLLDWLYWQYTGWHCEGHEMTNHVRQIGFCWLLSATKNAISPTNYPTTIASTKVLISAWCCRQIGLRGRCTRQGVPVMHQHRGAFYVRGRQSGKCLGVNLKW